MDELIADLFAIGALKVGKLKVAGKHRIYTDLPKILSHPTTYRKVIAALHELIQSSTLPPAAKLCGIEYRGIPLATGLALQHEYQAIIKLPETADPVINRMVHGDYKKGDQVLLLDYQFCSGTDIMETTVHLRKLDLVVVGTIVLLDRSVQYSSVSPKEFKVRALFTLDDVYAYLATNLE